MSPPRRRWWLWCAILLVLVSGWLLLRTPPGWYQPNQHASGAGERFEQLVVDQLTTLREQDQQWELSLDVASCNAFLAQRLRPWLQRESKGVLGMLDALGTPQMRMRPTDHASPPALIFFPALTLPGIRKQKTKRVSDRIEDPVSRARDRGGPSEKGRSRAGPGSSR